MRPGVDQRGYTPYLALGCTFYHLPHHEGAGHLPLGTSTIISAFVCVFACVMYRDRIRTECVLIVELFAPTESNGMAMKGIRPNA